MSVVIVTGSYPPEICGVGDYTYKLFTSANEDWKICHIKDWSIKSLLLVIKQIKKLSPTAIILQYPTEGYGWSLIPHFTSIFFSLFTKIKFITVLHEFSNMSIKAKAATLLFFFSNEIIFTSNYERMAATKVIPFIKNKTHVINIISNIDSPRQINSWEQRRYDLVYFGHIRPNKGLEDFFLTSNYLIEKNKDIQIYIIGQVLNQYKDYFENLKKNNIGDNFHFILNREAKEVSDILNNSKVCFLPFPDGLSERRGSFLAAISCGVKVISYDGKFVTDQLRSVCELVDVNSAGDKILSILSKFSSNSHKEHVNRCKKYLKENIPQDWRAIVKSYKSVIDKK